MFFGAMTWLTQKYVRIQPERQHARNGVNFRMKERTEEISIPFILVDLSFDELNNETESSNQVRWYGGKHDSLVDLRADVGLWGMQCESHHAELSPAHLGQSALEISEMALAKRCKRSCMNSKEKNMTGCLKEIR